MVSYSNSVEPEFNMEWDVLNLVLRVSVDTANEIFSTFKAAVELILGLAKPGWRSMPWRTQVYTPDPIVIFQRDWLALGVVDQFDHARA